MTGPADPVLAWLLAGDESVACRESVRLLLGSGRGRDGELNYARTVACSDVCINGRRRPDGTWPLQARHPGQTHFEMERPGAASRWNTLRVLKRYGA